MKLWILKVELQKKNFETNASEVLYMFVSRGRGDRLVGVEVGILPNEIVYSSFSESKKIVPLLHRST